MSSRAYPGVLLQHARDRSFSTSLFHSRLRTVFRDELMSSFYERPTTWGERLFTPCRPFAKGPRFMNMVMTFVLHPLSHYNSITESRARFLLSLLKHLTIDFPSHFILSIIDVHLDSTSRDKLIFSSAITKILCHFFVPFPSSDHFTVTLPLNVVRPSFDRGRQIHQHPSLVLHHPSLLHLHPLLLLQVMCL